MTSMSSLIIVWSSCHFFIFLFYLIACWVINYWRKSTHSWANKSYQDVPECGRLRVLCFCQDWPVIPISLQKKTKRNKTGIIWRNTCMIIPRIIQEGVYHVLIVLIWRWYGVSPSKSLVWLVSSLKWKVPCIKSNQIKWKFWFLLRGGNWSAQEKPLVAEWKNKQS